MEYFDFQAYGGVLEKYYRGLGFTDTYYGKAEQNTKILNAMKAMGYASGKRRITSDELAWTQELGSEMIVRPSSNAILTPMKAGDSVLKASATNTIFDFANNPAEFLKAFSYAGLDAPNMIQNSNDTYNNDVNFNFSLPNVTDANSLKNELINNPEIQRVIETITIGRLSGKSGNERYKYR